ncbi:hypothetical protein [Bernardetia litoralis]|nr:hypothetical protein [Bernardetia litoralis]
MSDIECFNLNYDLEKSKIRFSQLDLIIDTLSIGMHRERIIKLLGNGDTCNFEKNRSSQSFEIEKGKGLARISDIYYYNLSDTTIPYAVNFNGSSIDYLVLKLDDDTLSTIYFARGF